MQDAPISEFMTPAPQTVGAAQTISFALGLMNEHGFRHLPVLHGGKVVGLVSDRDLGLIAGLNDVDPDVTRVEEAATQTVYSVGSSTPLSEVVERMAEHKYGSAIVVDGESLKGIFTTHDVVRVLASALR